MKFYEHLRRLREGKGLTWYALGKASGVPKQTLQRLEDPDANPTLAMLRRLAEALGVTVAELVEGETAKPRRTPKRQ
jgi:transcriptional regulator with XRE-family HTH domain